MSDYEFYQESAIFPFCPFVSQISKQDANIHSAEINLFIFECETVLNQTKSSDLEEFCEPIPNVKIYNKSQQFWPIIEKTTTVNLYSLSSRSRIWGKKVCGKRFWMFTTTETWGHHNLLIIGYFLYCSVCFILDVLPAIYLKEARQIWKDAERAGWDERPTRRVWKKGFLEVHESAPWLGVRERVYKWPNSQRGVSSGANINI